MARKLDKSVIDNAINTNIPLTLKTYKLPRDMEKYVEKILCLYLDKFGQIELKDRITYCMKELATNAKKANTKRVYFSEKNLDINDSIDYFNGMKTFKKDILENMDYWLEKQRKAGLYIKIIFHSTSDCFYLYIKNNVAISKKEHKRIHERIEKAKTFNSLEESMMTVMDDSEGAGLGIVILVLMLKKIGLGEDAFDIRVIEDETVAKITIPFEKKHAENIDELSKKIALELDNLPQFPENVIYIQKLIKDPNSKLLDIARQISLDPSLTANLIKTVNSAQFMLPKKVENIFEAVKLLGLSGISNMLFSCETQKLLKTNQKSLWEHSRRVAFFSYNLAKNFKKQKEFHDDVYVGGILHDIGKIVFSNVHPKLLDKITQFCSEKNFKANILEELSAGMNHAMIGGKIAEKWDFPPSLVATITYHHIPEQAPEEFSEAVNIVYLANTMANYQTGLIAFDQINSKVLENLGIKDEKQFFSIIERLTTAFDNESASFN